MSNTSTIATTLAMSTVPDYWPEFGPLQYLEVIYLTIITVLGTIGNLIVIFSIALERRVHMHGNIFIINLAVADLLVSAIIVPTTIANVVKTENALQLHFCQTIGFLVTATCTCSLCNLMCIAINRYWAVVKSSTYQKIFSRKRVFFMVVFTWIWSALLVSPTVLGWGGLRFDAKMMVCSWDDEKDKSYTYFIGAIAIFLPLVVIAIAYYKLFSTVRGSGRWVRSLSTGSGLSTNSDQNRRSMQKERSLLRTLLTTVIMFCVCWVPFGACILINPAGTPAHAKKIFGWLALTNSCVNFIIYGAMNPVFRRGYHNLLVFVFRCKRAQQFSSAMMHGSFSDSFSRKNKRGSKGGQMLNGNAINNMSDANREYSRIDTGAQPAVSVVTQMTMPGGTPLMVRSTGKPSPLLRHENDFSSSTEQQSAPPASSTNTSHKKRAVQSIRRATFLRDGEARRNSAENVMTSHGLRENGTELQQIQMGGNDAGSRDELISPVTHERFSRRSLSDAAPVSQLTYQKHDKNGSCSNVPVLDVNDIASSGHLVGRWMPSKTVYTSKRSTTISQMSLTDSTSTKNETGSPNGSFARDHVTTVSGEINRKSKEIEMENENTVNDFKPKTIPVSLASHEMGFALEEWDLQEQIHQSNLFNDSTSPANEGDLEFPPDPKMVVTDDSQEFPPPPEEMGSLPPNSDQGSADTAR